MVKIEKVIGNKVYFQNGLIIGLSRTIISEYNLKRREMLSDEEYMKILEIAALSTSYYLLSKRDYSKRELFEKLYGKYFNKEIINKVMEILKDKGYLDDYEFARGYVNTHSYGKVKMTFMLKQKGITSDIIEEVLEDNRDEELENLRKHLKKIRGREVEKQIAALMRKGFNYGDIKKVMNEEN